MTPINDIQQDPKAMSLARAVKIANEAAVQEGLDVDAALVTVTEETAPPERLWRVHYGPRDYVGRRGGDLIVLVEEQTATVRHGDRTCKWLTSSRLRCFPEGKNGG